MLTGNCARRSLARDHKFELEKEQAVRLVRMLLSMPDTDQPVSASVIRAIVAIAESTEEKLRLSCLHILGELGQSGVAVRMAVVVAVAMAERRGLIGTHAERSDHGHWTIGQRRWATGRAASIVGRAA